MLQKVNTVFVGKNVNTAGSTLVAGDIVAIDATTGAVIAVADIESANAIQLGYVKATGDTDADATIEKTQVISKDKVKSNVYSAYVAKTEASSVLDWTGVTLVAGYRYVIRVIYNDIFEHPGQFTHSYEVVAAAGETINTLGDKFAARINAHKGARVTAAYVGSSTNTLTLTAKSVVDNGFGTQGKEAITPYSQVQMKVVAYWSNPSSVFNASYNQIAGLTITTVDSEPGKGNCYIVRDREQAALGYKGITFRTTWPIIKPELNVELDKTYDTLVVEFAKDYVSPDNQYVKSTDLAAEVYVVHGEDADTLADAIEAWINPTYVKSVVAGTGIDVDATDPQNPEVAVAA